MAWNYKTGGKPFKMFETKKEIDPRSKTSFRGKSYIAKGDENSVPAKQKKPYKVTWF